MKKLQLTSGMLLLAQHLARDGAVRRPFDRCSAKGLVARGLASFCDDQETLQRTGQTERLLRGELGFDLRCTSTCDGSNHDAEQLARSLATRGGWTCVVMGNGATRVYAGPKP